MSILWTSCASENENFLEPGISQELAAQRKNSLSDIIYNLSFDIPQRKGDSINAELTLTFSLSDLSRDLILDFNADEQLIKKVEKGGVPIDFEWKNEHLIIGSEYLAEKNEITISLIAGDQSLNRREEYLYTLFVPERASTCFPVFDQPNLKSKYRLTLKVPTEWTAVANGILESKSEEGGKSIYKFQETLPISSYLFAFSAGKFQLETAQIDGREMNLYHRESDSVKVARNLDQIFEWHSKSIRWLEDYTGVNYPFPKFDFVLLPSFQYGGMEHPGAIFYKASSLFLDESSTLNQQIGRGRLIAHETAHMWFGNLVTMDWFNDVWLKEVFANFMAAKIVNPEFPEIDHDLKFLFGHYPRAYEVDRTNGTHAIQQNLGNLKNAGSLYGAIIYQKAPIVMRMLEDNMGQDNFQEGIREYVTSYPFDNATWDDLVNIMSKYTDYELDSWNEQWVKSPGMPSIYYSLRSKDDKTLSKFNLHTMVKEGGSQWWPQNIEVMIGAEDSVYRKKAPLLSPDLNLDIEGNPFPEFIFSNASGLGYGYFNMRSSSIDHFLDNVNEYESSLLRSAIWVNLYESVVRGEIPAHRLIKTALSSLATEKEALIISYINKVITTLFWNFYSVDQQNELASKLEGVLLNMMINSESQSLKATFFNTLMSVTTSKNGNELLRSIWKHDMDVEGLSLSESDYIRLAYELAVREMDEYEKILARQLTNIKDPDRKKRMEFVIPALSDDVKVRDQFFDSLKDPVNRENEEWVLEALRYLHHPLRTQSSHQYIESSLQLLEEIKQTGDIFFPKRWLDNTLGNYRSEEAENAVRQFLYQNNKYPEDLKNKILQSADILFRAREIERENERNKVN